MYPKAEILFPPKLIPTLRDLRGPEWAVLVRQVSNLPETHPDALAFCIMMIELDGCLNCYAGSYKFMRGCAACARQTISQFKGSDADLLRHFQRAQQRIRRYLENPNETRDQIVKEVAGEIDEEIQIEIAEMEEEEEPEVEVEIEIEIEEEIEDL